MNNVTMDIDDTYVICKYSEEHGYNTRFLNNQLFCSKQEAEDNLENLQAQVEEKIRVVEESGLVKIVRFRLEVMTLAKFIHELENYMYERGRENA